MGIVISAGGWKCDDCGVVCQIELAEAVPVDELREPDGWDIYRWESEADDAHAYCQVCAERRWQRLRNMRQPAVWRDVAEKALLRSPQ